MCKHLVDRPPGAREHLVGAPAEQERLCALVGLRDERPGLIVALLPGYPPRSDPFAVIRRVAVSPVLLSGVGLLDAPGGYGLKVVWSQLAVDLDPVVGVSEKPDLRARRQLRKCG